MQGRLRQKAPPKPREDLEQRGPPRCWEQWCLLRRGEKRGGLCHGCVGIPRASGFRGSRSPRLRGRVGRGWAVPAVTAEHCIKSFFVGWPLASQGRRRGHRDLGNDRSKAFAHFELSRWFNVSSGRQREGVFEYVWHFDLRVEIVSGKPPRLRAECRSVRGIAKSSLVNPCVFCRDSAAQ